MANAENNTFPWQQIAYESIAAIQARMWLIVAVTVIAAVVSSFREITTPSYGAEALVAVTPLTAKGELVAAVPQTFEPKAYERLFLSSTVLGLVGERLAEAGHYGDAGPPSIEVLQNDFSLNIDLLDQTTRPVSFSPILRMNARASTPELAVEKVEAWVAVSTEIGNKALASKVNAASATLEAQRIQLESSIDDLNARLREEKANWNLDALRKDIELALLRMDLLTIAHQEAEQVANGAREQIVVIEAELAEEKPVRVYRKAPSDDAIFIAGEQGNPTDPLTGAVMVTEEENPVYTELREEEVEVRAAEAESKAKLKTIGEQLATASQALSKLKSDLAAHEVVQEMLTSEIEIARTVYTDIAQASSFSDAAKSLTRESGETGERAVGLNPISDRIFPIKYDGVFGSKVSVFIATLTAFALITAFVLLREVGIPRMRAAFDDTPPA